MKTFLKLLSLTLILVGCAPITSNNNNHNLNDSYNKLSIVTTSFVTYDFARSIASEQDVTLIVKPGQDTHSFEPTAQDMVAIENADLLIYTNDELEPWVKQLVNISDDRVVNASQDITMIDFSGNDIHDDHDHDDHGGHSHFGLDPHTWTSMKNAQIMVDTIVQAIIKLDSGNQTIYQKNAASLNKKLAELDAEYEEIFDHSQHDSLVFLGHFSLSYLLHDYDMEYLALFESLSHESEPTIGQLQSIIDEIKDEELKYVFAEELTQLKVVETIEQETGVEVLHFNSAHTISSEEMKNGISFIEIQVDNLENLHKGLAVDD